MLDGLGQLAFFDYMAGWKTAHSSYLSICLALAYFSCFFFAHLFDDHGS